MTVASGTSTPTSITVVATKTAARPARKSSIAASFSAAFMRPCSRRNARREFALEFGEAALGRSDVELVIFLDQRADPKHALVGFDGAADGLDDLFKARQGQGARRDRLSPNRFFGEPRYVHVAVSGERERARDRRLRS